ncbi:helix-turn-helix domain-containing protein [Spirillospora sp. NPDC048911]|uniref:helix-turn-helix domain-containing protein n=1 Tax=Spirillospora sp. NPDC048911 TaxID=3364527 RepID=UPI0037141CD5
MPSPYVRRRRLAVELRKIREDRDMTADGLARFVYQSRTKITRLETGAVRPDLAEIMDMLERLGVTGSHYDKVVRLARDAAQKGWWDSFGDSMGARQRLYADLESGSDTIRGYNQTGFPAVLQLPDFIKALVELDEHQGPLDYRPERMADARAHRQRRLLQPDGPSYETVLDESVVHRLAVPPLLMANQLRHLVGVITEEPRISIRVLLHNSRVPGGLLPKSSFFLYTFPEPADPTMAVVDTVTTDLVLTDRREVARYTRHYERLQEAALSTADSLGFLSRVADRLTNEAGSGA